VSSETNKLKIARTKQTVRRGNYIPVKLSAQDIKHLNLSNADLEYGIRRMSEIMKFAKNAEYERR
jgi:hypothetical protein